MTLSINILSILPRKMVVFKSISSYTRVKMVPITRSRIIIFKCEDLLVDFRSCLLLESLVTSLVLLQSVVHNFDSVALVLI